jgi:hypothetical protein
VKKSALVFLAALAACAVVYAVPAPSFSVESVQKNLDAFMKEVLAKRDENWKKLQQYILDEKEKIEIRGLGGMPIWGERREFQWFVKDGYFVRSPVTADGVKVSESDRQKYEENFLRRSKERDKRDAERAAKAAEPGAEPPQPPTNVEALITQTRQPQFVDSAYFMKFKFDLGTYALVGKENFSGHDVLRIEYYPTKLFNDDEDRERRQAEAAKKGETQKPRSRGDEFEDSINHLMNKNSMVTLWVEPTAKQIVRYKFDNVKMDFLPVAWLVRMEALKATMNMSEPFKDVWLPKDVEIEVSALLAIGPFDFSYRLDYFDYREAKTSGRIRGRGGDRR